MIRRNGETNEDLTFLLNNPTERTHAFEAPGLLEQTNARNGSPLTKPLRVTVAPGETMEIVVRFAPLDGNPEPSCRAGAVCYRFSCPFHRGDDDPGGIIHLVP